jgi:MFS family permease
MNLSFSYQFDCLTEHHSSSCLIFTLLRLKKLGVASQNFAPDYMESRLGISLTDAGRLYALAGVASAVVAPLLGLAFDRAGRLPLCLVVAAACFALALVPYLFFRPLGLMAYEHRLVVLIAAVCAVSVAEAAMATLKQVMIVRSLPAIHFAVLQGLIQVCEQSRI